VPLDRTDYAGALDRAAVHAPSWLTTSPDRPVPFQADADAIRARLGESLPEDRPTRPRWWTRSRALNDVVYTQVCGSFGADSRTEAVARELIADGAVWMSGSRMARSRRAPHLGQQLVDG
jgi:hypothetical protein